MWEYKFIVLSGDPEELCNSVGADGWELVQVVVAAEAPTHAIFKRKTHDPR